MFKLRSFGSISIEDAQGNRYSLRSRKHLALLLYLCSKPRSLHPRDELAELLWDDCGRRERHSLSQALYDIRATLGDVLETSAHDVRLRPDRFDFDGARLEAAVADHAHDEALDLYDGDFAPGLLTLGCDLFDRWVDGERDRYRLLAMMAIREALEDAELSGDWDRVCLSALRLIRMNDLDQRAHRALMRGLFMKGDPDSALDHGGSLLQQKAEQASEDRDRTEALTRIINSCVPAAVRNTRLTGRAREFRQLTLHLRSIADLEGGTIIVRGPKGAGKSRLISEVRQFHRLAAVEWAPVTGAQRVQLFESAKQRRCVADRCCLAAPNLSCSRVDIVESDCSQGTCRAVSQTHVIELAPLSNGATRQVVESIGAGLTSAERSQVAEGTGGLPGLIRPLVEVMRRHGRVRDCGTSALDQVLGDWIADVRERVDALTPTARSLLEVIAGFPDGCEVALVRRAVPAAAHAMIELEDHWLVQRDGDLLRLTAPVLRDEVQWASPQAISIRHAVARLALQDPSLSTRRVVALVNESASQQGFWDIAVARVREHVHYRPSLAPAGAEVALALARDSHERRQSLELAVTSALAAGNTRKAEEHLTALAGEGCGRASEIAACRLHSALLDGIPEVGESRFRDFRQAVSNSSEPTSYTTILESWARLSLFPSAASAARLTTVLQGLQPIPDRAGLAWVAAAAGLVAETSSRAGVQPGRRLVERLSAAASALCFLNRARLELLGASLLLMDEDVSAGVAKLTAVVDRLRDLDPHSEQFAIGLNNLAVGYMEIGDFKSAWDLIGECSKLDDRIGTAPWARYRTELNAGICAFYSGDTNAAAGRCRAVRELAGRTGIQSLERDASVWQALVQTETQTPVEPPHSQMAEPSNLADPFKDYWFEAARWLPSAPRASLEAAEAGIESCRTVDRPGAMKLELVAAYISESIWEGRAAMRTLQVRRRLRESGLGWFSRRFDSWWRAARLTQPS